MSALFDKIRKLTVSTLSDFTLIEKNDRVLVAVSGGIDSTTLLMILLDIQRRAPFEFTLTPVLVDHKFPGSNHITFSNWIAQHGLKLKILECDTYTIIKQERETDSSPCHICSRLRRGVLYNYAREGGYNKIALGHNRDDLNETLLMNMFYSGKLAGMPPKLIVKDGNSFLIRPLCRIPKSIISQYFSELGAPLIENDFCKDIQNSARYRIRSILTQLESQNPKITENLLASQGNLIPKLLMDGRFHEF